MMEKNAKIYVAGHRGMVGSAILRELQRQGYTNFVLRTHKELNLMNQTAVEEFFATEKPEYVFLAAAKVGGIVANESALADFMYDNMMLENDAGDERHPQRMEERLQETGVPWLLLHLSPHGSPADDGKLSADWRT